MPIPYEILIRGNADGTLSGAHAISTASDNARPITADDLSEIAPDINAAFLAARDEAEQARDAALAELTGVRALAAKICNAAVETVNDESLTQEQVRATIVALCGEATKPAKVRELDAIKKQEAEIAAKKKALEAELSKQD